MENRNANLDLMRLLAAFQIIVIHIIVQGGITLYANPNKALYWAAWFLEIISYCSVDLFALISGYIMVNKTVRFKNIFALWIQAFFYSVLISALFFVFLPETKTIKNLLLSFFPILGKQWWYISAYFGLLIFVPILNIAVANLPKHTFRSSLLAMLVLFGFADRFFTSDAFMLNNGSSALWLIVMYLFGAYLKKYDCDRKVKPAKCLLGFGILVCVTFLTKLSIHFATKLLLGKAQSSSLFVSHTSITIVLAAILLFLFCLNLRIPPAAEKVILFLSPVPLGVYMIHVHPLVFKHLIKNAFIQFTDMSVPVMMISVLLSAAAIFLICSIIDLLRIQFFNLIQVNKIRQLIDDVNA